MYYVLSTIIVTTNHFTVFNSLAVYFILVSQNFPFLFSTSFWFLLMTWSDYIITRNYSIQFSCFLFLLSSLFLFPLFPSYFFNLFNLLNWIEFLVHFIFFLLFFFYFLLFSFILSSCPFYLLVSSFIFFYLLISSIRL